MAACGRTGVGFSRADPFLISKELRVLFLWSRKGGQ